MRVRRRRSFEIIFGIRRPEAIAERKIGWIEGLRRGVEVIKQIQIILTRKYIFQVHFRLGRHGREENPVQFVPAGKMQIRADILGQRGVRGETYGINVRGVSGDAEKRYFTVFSFFQGHHAVGVVLGPEVELVH